MGYFEVEKIPLKVIRDDGFDVSSGVGVKETSLLFNTSTNNAPTFFYNSGDTGIDFEVSVYVKQDYTYQGKPIATYLDYWNKWSTVVSVVTSAFDVPNGKYIMTVKSKTQKSFKGSVWKIRFKQYYENELSFENANLHKGYSLPAPCLILQQYDEINSSSPREAILALQILLVEKGCFSFVQDDSMDDRVPTGIWDEQMSADIFSFQYYYGLPRNKHGQCDRETILAILKDNLNVGGYDYGKGYVEL